MTGNYLHRRTVSIISAGNSPLVPKSLPVHRVGVSLVLMGFGHHYAGGGGILTPIRILRGIDVEVAAWFD